MSGKLVSMARTLLTGADLLTFSHRAPSPIGAVLQLAGFEIIHDESGVRTVEGVLAANALALDQAVRNLIAFVERRPCRRGRHGHVDTR